MFKKILYRNIFSLVIAALVAFTFCFYTTLVSFLGNQNAFAFNLLTLIRALIIPFLVVMVVVFLILFITNELIFLRKKEIVKIQDTITPMHIAFGAIVFCTWLEGFILSKGLPQIDGGTNLFSSTKRLLIDSSIWVVVLVVAIVFWRKFTKYIVPLTLALVLLMSFGLVDAYISKSEKVPVRATSTEVLDRIKFSEDNNVIILVLDSMSTGILKEYIDNNPTLKDDLEGFVMFENNIESAKSTQWSLPGMLRGDYYDGEEEEIEYQSGAYTNKDSLPVVFSERGYNYYSSSFLSTFNDLKEGNKIFESNTSSKIEVNSQLYGQLFIRFSPYTFKNSIASNVGFSTDTVQGASDNGNIAKSGVELGKAKYDETVMKILNYTVNARESDVSTFQFHHIGGPHKPYTMASDGSKLEKKDEDSLYGLFEQMNWSMGLVREFISLMKENDIYNSSTIVILGDHGDRKNDVKRKYEEYTKFASLMIKPKGSTDDFSVSDAPTSNSYLVEMLEKIHLNDENLEDIVKEYYGKERKAYLPSANKMYIYEGANIPELEVSNYIQDKKKIAKPLTQYVKYTLSNTDRIDDVAIALEMTGAVNRGYGIVSEAETFSFKFLVEEKLRGKKCDVMLRLGHKKYPEENGLTVTDVLSGEKQEFMTSKDRKNIIVKGVQISDTEEPYFELELKIDNYMKKQFIVTIKHMLVDKEAK